MISICNVLSSIIRLIAGRLIHKLFVLKILNISKIRETKKDYCNSYRNLETLLNSSTCSFGT
jgi:hypothetical protein